MAPTPSVAGQTQVVGFMFNLSLDPKHLSQLNFSSLL